MNGEDINRRFTHLGPDAERAQRQEKIRLMIGDLGHELKDLLPESREAGLAMTRLEEALMWANAAIAREQQ